MRTQDALGYACSVGGTPIGTVAAIAGNPRARRWVAWSAHRKSASEENSAAFPSRRMAADWLAAEHRKKRA